MAETEIGNEGRILVKVTGDGEVTILFLRDSYMNYAYADQMKPLLKWIVADEMARGRRRFVLNLTQVTVMDSCGLAVLISLKKFIGAGGGRLAVTNLSSMIQRLFALTRLDKAFEIHASEEDAIGAT